MNFRVPLTLNGSSALVDVARGGDNAEPGHNEHPREQFVQLISHFSMRACRFSLIAHAPLGETVAATRARGHSLGCSAKTIVVKARKSARSEQFFALLVVPGDHRADFSKAKQVLGAKKLGFALAAEAEQLMRCVSGSIPPVSFDPSVKVVVDERLRIEDFLVFNASQLDISMKIDTHDYLRVVTPILADISEPLTEERSSPHDAAFHLGGSMLIHARHS